MIWWIAAAVIAVASIVAELVAGPHGDFPWHRIPAFDLAYGFLGCLVIIVVSKALGKWFIQRPEGYTPERSAIADDPGGAQ